MTSHDNIMHDDIIIVNTPWLPIHFRLQTCLIPLNTIDFLGHLENFDKDIAIIMAELGIASTTHLQQKNATRNRAPYQHYYTPERRERVAKLYQEDIETFAYEF